MWRSMKSTLFLEYYSTKLESPFPPNIWHLNDLKVFDHHRWSCIKQQNLQLSISHWDFFSCSRPLALRTRSSCRLIFTVIGYWQRSGSVVLTSTTTCWSLITCGPTSWGSCVAWPRCDSCQSCTRCTRYTHTPPDTAILHLDQHLWVYSISADKRNYPCGFSNSCWCHTSGRHCR